MALRVCVLGSGSKGNSTLVASSQTAILVDAGLSARELERRLAEAGGDAARLAGICLSHEHADHTAGIAVLHRRHAVPVYANAGTREALAGNAELAALPWRVFENGQAFAVGDLEVHPFGVSHDAYDPVGFVIGGDGARVGIVTDIGIVTELVRQHLRTCRAVVVESNHDEELLRRSRRPPSLIQRVLGRQGHLSNDAAAKLLAAIASPDLTCIYLAHLSEECNRPDYALRATRQALAKAGYPHIDVRLTHADRPSEPWEG